MENMIITAVVFVIGLVIGSFSNVCIYRVPRNESLISPGSHCPQCNKPIQFYDNIPVISYMILQGKCRYCSKQIPFQYPLVELLTGLLYISFYLFFGLQLVTFVYMLLGTVLIIITFIDLKEKIIPDILSYPFMIIGFLFSFFREDLTPMNSFLGILAGGGSLLLVAVAGTYLFKKEAMGGGDVKLAAMIGAFLGWQLTLLSLFFGFFLGAIIGIIILVLSKGKSEIVPFGPFIALGTIITIFWGENIINWYRMI